MKMMFIFSRLHSTYLNKGITTVVKILSLSILGLGQLQMMFGFLPLGVSLFPQLSKFKFQCHLLVVSGTEVDFSF